MGFHVSSHKHIHHQRPSLLSTQQASDCRLPSFSPKLETNRCRKIVSSSDCSAGIQLKTPISSLFLVFPETSRSKEDKVVKLSR
nr:uncharacterized protein LOC107433017 isoform X2 [Ziziphus jujuba var. spinosa]